MKKKLHTPEKIILVCLGSKCKEKGNKDLVQDLKKTIKENHLKNTCEIIKVNCLGKCKYAPIVSVQPDNVWFSDITQKEIKHQIENRVLLPSIESKL
ncbi:MAG: (2Fe-2S) ferredoxin domain-containing protein [Cytophagales bacterium]|nr:MAG: (2Fe-2S) ferredoxin domain-containing protein [Cytophagales bacterium]